MRLAAFQPKLRMSLKGLRDINGILVEASINPRPDNSQVKRMNSTIKDAKVKRYD
jgi:hypothetical protein